MCRSIMDTPLTDLLDLLTPPDAIAPDAYLVKQRDGVTMLWRLSEGGPDDGALDPAPGWLLLPAYSNYPVR